MADRSPERPLISPHRLVALGDGVFAIAMTLLVFQLGAPAISSTRDLTGLLLDMWPDFAMYALSFLVLGVFWLVHHVLFDVIERYDTTLVWLNIAYLMFAALVPFSTDLVAEHGATAETAVVYGLTLMSVFGTGWGIFAYATHEGRLVAVDLDRTVVRGGRIMGLVYMLYVLLSLLVALLSPMVAFLLYGLGVSAIVVSTLVGRGDVVFLWRTGRPDELSGDPGGPGDSGDAPSDTSRWSAA